MFIAALKKDARYFQLLFQLSFLCYGLYFLQWQQEWWLYITYFLTSMVTQFLCEVIVKKSIIKKLSAAWWACYKKNISSAIISSLSLSLLLKTNHISVAVFAAVVSIASKYIIRINGKHIFNPSALGIVSAIFITGQAWISPGQWGSGAVILFSVLCLGFIITTRVQKLDISLAFLGSFGGLLFLRQIIYLGWPMDYFIQSISTGSLLLFSFFMITDPKTIPNHLWARILWCMAIAGIAFYLTAFKFINGAPILVLVASQPLVPVLDHFFRAKKFEWQTTAMLSKNDEAFLNTAYNNLSL
jgi:Na+-transporting NADH:ubiquinone oxidoreductase subunit NqrB